VKLSCFTVGLALVGSLAASLLFATGAHAQVNVNIYETHTTDAGGGAPYSDPVGSFVSPTVSFGTDTGFNWHPFGLDSFGADITGCFTAPTTGVYQFATNSDDGSQLFLNGVLNVDNGGPHGPNFAAGSPIALTAGDNVDLHLQFYEDFGGPAGLDLLVQGPGDEDFNLVSSNDLTCVPEPGSLALLATGGMPFLGLLRRRWRA
jgi:hypothetical protein